MMERIIDEIESIESDTYGRLTKYTTFLRSNLGIRSYGDVRVCVCVYVCLCATKETIRAQLDTFQKGRNRKSDMFSGKQESFCHPN